MLQFLSPRPRISNHFNIEISFMCNTNNTVVPKMIESKGRNIDFQAINTKLKAITWNFTYIEIYL